MSTDALVGLLLIVLGLVVLLVIVPWVQGRVHILPRKGANGQPLSRRERVEMIERFEAEETRPKRLALGLGGVVSGAGLPDVIAPLEKDLFGPAGVEEMMEILHSEIRAVGGKVDQLMGYVVSVLNDMTAGEDEGGWLDDGEFWNE